jgi:hypothetical protein
MEDSEHDLCMEIAQEALSEHLAMCKKLHNAHAGIAATAMVRSCVSLFVEVEGKQNTLKIFEYILNMYGCYDK